MKSWSCSECCIPATTVAAERKWVQVYKWHLCQRWQKVSSSWQKPQWLSVQRSVCATCLFVVTAPCFTSTAGMIPQRWKLCPHGPMMFTRIPSQSLSEKTRESIQHLLWSSVHQTHDAGLLTQPGSAPPSVLWPDRSDSLVRPEWRGLRTVVPHAPNLRAESYLSLFLGKCAEPASRTIECWICPSFPGPAGTNVYRSSDSSHCQAAEKLSESTAAAYGKGDAAQSGDGGELSTNPWPPSDTGSTSTAVQCPTKPWRFHYSESVPRNRGCQLHDNQGPSPVGQMGLDPHPFRQWGTDFYQPHCCRLYLFCFLFSSKSLFPGKTLRTLIPSLLHCSPAGKTGWFIPLRWPSKIPSRFSQLTLAEEAFSYKTNLPLRISISSRLLLNTSCWSCVFPVTFTCLCF